MKNTINNLKGKSLTTDTFFDACEKENKLDVFDRLCDGFITAMKLSNPDMRLSDEKWLSILRSEYKVVVYNGLLNHYILEPIS